MADDVDDEKEATMIRVEMATSTSSYPRLAIGEEVTLRGVAYADNSRGDEHFAVSGGDFVRWWESPDGDVLAELETTHGTIAVRWSMIEGIDGPDGLLGQ
jgi:hypothetical protein